MIFLAAKSLLLFSTTCLWVVSAGEVLAFSQSISADVYSALEFGEEADSDDLSAKLRLGFQAVFDFKPASLGFLEDFSAVAPCSHTRIHTQMRGPPANRLSKDIKTALVSS